MRAYINASEYLKCGEGVLGIDTGHGKPVAYLALLMGEKAGLRREIMGFYRLLLASQ